MLNVPGKTRIRVEVGQRKSSAVLNVFELEESGAFKNKHIVQESSCPLLGGAGLNPPELEIVMAVCGALRKAWRCSGARLGFDWDNVFSRNCHFSVRHAPSMHFRFSDVLGTNGIPFGPEPGKKRFLLQVHHQ
ncbi:MAG: hypothetical protein HC869_04685 [Rhodospirillales bacterium]|nr:hypothetical protein [Rhodospirillales bacterium]